MHAYRTNVHESTGYSPFQLMMGEECSLPQDVSTTEFRTKRENDIAPHPFAICLRDTLEVAYDHVRDSLQKTAARRKRLYNTKVVNRKFPVGSWVLQYYPPPAQHKLGSPWIGPHQVVRQATGLMVGIQRNADKPIICRRFEIMPRTTGCFLDPKHPHSSITMREHGGLLTGLSYKQYDL